MMVERDSLSQETLQYEVESSSWPDEDIFWKLQLPRKQSCTNYTILFLIWIHELPSTIE